MSTRSMPFYQAVCDFPGCGAVAQESSEYMAWASPQEAIDDAENAGWWIGVRDAYHYCQEHPTVWEADLEDGVEAAPPVPYLRIPESGGVVLVLSEEPGEPDEKEQSDGTES